MMYYFNIWCRIIDVLNVYCCLFFVLWDLKYIFCFFKICVVSWFFFLLVELFVFDVEYFFVNRDINWYCIYFEVKIMIYIILIFD